MRCQYLAICIIGMLIFSGGEAQAQLFARKTTQPNMKRARWYTLEQGLQSLERTFKVSIAYKDEWIRDKKAAVQLNNFFSVEEGLQTLLRDTDLLFEKASENYYIIYKERTEPAPRPDQTASRSSDVFPVETSSLFMHSPLPRFNVQMDVQVSGTVTDDNGSPFPGVNVIEKGTSNGTSTNADGQYTITVQGPTSILVFSFVGFASQEITVGSSTNIDIKLMTDVRSLDEVVVTALGIERSSKSLGWSAAKVNSEELTVNRTTNPINALQGKIAGVSISSLGTGPSGSSKIRIRGQSSFNGQTTPLLVVNGVPIDNSNYGTNPNNAGADNSVGVRTGGGITSDGGDAFSSINPDDIETMTVLKGAAASALYGYRAKNGVIMITTKTKGEGRGIGVAYNLNYTNETPLDFTDYQYEYGQGEGGVRPTAPFPTSGQWSFGERFTPGQTQILFDGVEVPYVPQRDIIKKFFRNGQNTTHTLSFSTGGEKGGMNLSLSNMDSKGIVPNNTFYRKIVNFGYNYQLSEKLSFRGSINYSNENINNPPNVGNQDNTIPVAIFNMANSMPLDLLDEKKYDANGNEFVYSRFRNRTNPYFTLAEQFQEIQRDRLFGNISIKYDILPWLYIQGRVGQDFYSRDERYNNFPTGQASRAAAPPGFVNGVFTQEARRFRELNTDFLVSANKTFDDFGINAFVGGNSLYLRTDLNSVQVTDFVVRDLYTVQNGRAKDPIYTLAEQKVNSLYGSLEFSYKEMFYLTGTARNDWFSTLSKDERSILYPSISGSFVFSEAFTPPSWLSFGKVRVAYAEVGSDGDVGPYSNQLFYATSANLFSNPAGVPQPVGFPNSNTLPNAGLVPARTAETEIGLDLRFLDARVNLDIAVYNKITSDQIVTAQISDASGFENTRINSGESRNRGIEMLLNLIPIETSSFTWNFTANAAYNITKVLSLSNDTPGSRITVGTHLFNGELRQVVGEEMAQITGFGYRRNEEGQIIYGANGLPLRTLEPIYFGSALPRWVGGFTNSFNYKGISLSVLIDFKLGGKMLSGTNFNAIRHGLHRMTLEGREGGVVGEGVNEAGEVNDVVAPVQQYWEVVRSQALVEPAIYDAGYWKLRQITLGYDFSKFLPESLPLKSLRLSFVANNVAMLKKWVDNIDPESFGFTSDNLAGMESTGIPTTRSLGFNLNAKF